MIEVPRQWAFQPQIPADPNRALFGPGALVWTGAQRNIVTQQGARRIGANVTANPPTIGNLGQAGSWAAASGDGLRFPNWRPDITSACTCFVVAAPVSGNSNPETAFALSPDASVYGKYPSVTFQFNVNPYGSLGYSGQVTLACANTTSEFACWGYDGGIDGALHCWACSIDTTDSYMLRDGVDITYPGAGQPYSGTMTRPEQQFFIGAHPAYDGARTMTSPLYLVAIVPRKMSRAEAANISAKLLKNLGFAFQRAPLSITFPASGGGGVTGTAAIILAGDTSSATGTTTVKGTAAPTLGNDTSSATGVVGSVSGTAAITLAGATSSAQGTTSIGGTGAVTLGNDTCSASGAVGSAITGTAAITLGNDTSSATGTTKILGSAAITLGSDFSTTQGTTKILGTAAITLGDDFATAFGTSGTPTTVSSPRGLTIRIGLAL